MRKLLLAAQLLVPAAALAAPHGMMRPGAPRPRQATKLLYYGGPVISHAKVYAVLWGDAVSAETKAKVGPFYTNILDSAYMDFLSEYDTNGAAVDGRQGTHQHIGRGSFGGTVTIQPANKSKTLTDADIQKELEGQIAAGKLAPAGPDNLYMTYFPSGYSISIEGQRSCQAFCAYHEGFNSQALNAPVYYGVMPVCGSWGCGGSSAWESLEISSSHEALEAITDPFPTPGSNPAYPQAWNTSSGEEIADLCQGSSASVTGHGTTSTVQAEFKNSLGACFNGPWNFAAAVRPAHDADPLGLGALGVRLPALGAASFDGR